MANCRICGAPHKSCGPATTVTPIDRITRREATVGVKRYDTVVNGTPTVLLLSDEDAKRMGLLKTEEKKAATPANKSRAAKNPPKNK